MIENKSLTIVITPEMLKRLLGRKKVELPQITLVPAKDLHLYKLERKEIPWWERIDS